MKRKSIIIIFLILLLIVLVYVGKIYMKERKEKLQTGKPLTPNISTKEDGVLNLSGVGVYFDKSTGAITSSQVGHYLTDLITIYMPELMEELDGADSEEELKTFYNNNQKELKDNFGVNTVDEFKEMYNKLKSKNIDFKQYDKVQMDYDSFIDSSENTPKDNYSYAKCRIIYIDDSTIDFELFVRYKSHYEYPTYIVNFE